MPLQPSDIEFRYSNNDLSLTAGNSDQAIPPTINTLANVCLGGWLSTVPWSGMATNDLFSNITGVQNQSMVTDYRCVFVCNKNQFLTLYSAVVFLPNQVTGGADAYIAVDPHGVVPMGQSGAGNYQAIRMDNPTSEPTNNGNPLGWTQAPSRDFALSLGDLTPLSCVAIWFKRRAKNTSPLNNDGVTIRVEGDSPE